MAKNPTYKFWEDKHIQSISSVKTRDYIILFVIPRKICVFMFGEKGQVCKKKISCFSDDNPALERRKIQLCLPKCKPGFDELGGLYTFKFLKQKLGG